MSDILQDSQESYFGKLEAWQVQMESNGYSRQTLRPYESKIAKARAIRDRNISEQSVDQDLVPEDVIKIFSRINKNGKLPSRGDLEMAWIVARWKDAKQHIFEEVNKWKDTPMEKAINTDSIIRTMEAVHTGRYRPGENGFRAAEPSEQELKQAFEDVAAAHAEIHNFIKNDLGFKEARTLNSSTPMTILARYLKKNQHHFPNRSEKAKAIGYFLTSSALPVYHGSTATQIDSDLRAIDSEEPWKALHDSAQRKIGEIRFGPERFTMNRRSPGRFGCMLNLLALQPKALDLLTKLPVRNYDPSELEQHHIFPRIHLLENGKTVKEIDSTANIVVITKASNFNILHRAPSEYLAEIDNEDPSILKEHCIPQNRPLWNIENYDTFLNDRRQMQAEKVTEIIDNMNKGTMP